MTRPPNPISSGFRAVRRDPAVFLVEILWRWTYAIVALLLLFMTGATLLGPLNVGPIFSLAWQTHDYARMGFAVVNILLLLGNKVITAAIFVPVAIVLLWSILAALGRRITVKRLRPVSSLGFRPMLALQSLRGFVTWISLVLLVAAVGGEAYIAILGSKPNLFLYYEMVVPSVLVIAIFWLITNWYLTIATIFGEEGQSFYRAFRLGRRTVRLQRSDFSGTGFVFLLFRLVVLLVALAICGLTSSMVGTAPQTYFALVTVVALFYFAISDFLYMARMASYLALAAARKETASAEAGASSSQLPAG